VMTGEPSEPTAAQAYVPFDQQPVRALTVLVRTGAADAAIAAVRREVARLDPEQPLYDVKTLEQALFEAAASDRVIMGMFVLFAAVALGLGILGLYSLVSYLVSQRMREMGVRVALGASRADIVRLVLTRGAGLVAVGLVAGLPVGLGLSRVMAGVLTGVSPTDAVTFTLVPLTLLPLLFPDDAVLLLLISSIVYYAGPNLGSPQWSSLMGDIVPEARRGRFFALRTQLASVASFLAPGRSTGRRRAGQRRPLRRRRPCEAGSTPFRSR